MKYSRKKRRSFNIFGLLFMCVCIAILIFYPGVLSDVFMFIENPPPLQVVYWYLGVGFVILIFFVLLRHIFRNQISMLLMRLPAWLYTPHEDRIFKNKPTRYEYGWVYVMSNPTMPGILKIGTTQVHPSVRAKQLHGTGVAQPFRVLYSKQTGFAVRVEAQVHRLLYHCRVSEGREFFTCDLPMAIKAINAACAQVKEARPR